jgi:hypothetical protein
MPTGIRRELRMLRAYMVLSTAAFATMAVSAFRHAAPTKFDEIDVQRINIVEPGGAYRMVLANRARSIGPIYRGKPFGYPGGDRPGIIFFNDEGTENGGLTFDGRRDSTGQVTSSGHLSFDQYNMDQVMVLEYSEQNGHRRTGLAIDDMADADIYDWVMKRDSVRKMPAGAARDSARRELLFPHGQPLRAARVFAGRDEGKNAVVSLGDANGKPRLRLVVDSAGSARIEFLDTAGVVTSRLP